MDGDHAQKEEEQKKTVSVQQQQQQQRGINYNVVPGVQRYQPLRPVWAQLFWILERWPAFSDVSGVAG